MMNRTNEILVVTVSASLADIYYTGLNNYVIPLHNFNTCTAKLNSLLEIFGNG